MADSGASGIGAKDGGWLAQVLGAAQSLRSMAALRADGWINTASGFGTDRDRSEYGYFQADPPIDPEEATSLFATDDLAHRIVSIVPSECMRRPWSLDCAPEVAARLASWAGSVSLRREVLDAWTWGRLYGGAVLVLGAEDGLDAREPLVRDRVKSFRWVKAYDKRSLSVVSWYREDPTHPKHGLPRTYLVTDPFVGTTYEIHESRTVHFGGAKTDPHTRMRLGGWDHSVLRVVYRTLRQFNAAFAGTDVLLSESSQGILKVRGLIGALASGQKSRIEDRMHLFDLSRSMLRSVLVDADGEDYTKIVTPLSGLGEVLDRVANRLSAATEIPVTVLMGQAPAGLSATGDADIRIWYDKLASHQSEVLGPALRRVYRLAARAMGVDPPDGVTFAPLWTPTERESAETRKIDADTDAIYLSTEVLSPEEVRARRFPDLADVEAEPARAPRVEPSAEALASVRPEAAHGA